jgi:hypothetical protein
MPLDPEFDAMGNPLPSADVAFGGAPPGILTDDSTAHPFTMDARSPVQNAAIPVEGFPKKAAGIVSPLASGALSDIIPPVSYIEVYQAPSADPTGWYRLPDTASFRSEFDLSPPGHHDRLGWSLGDFPFFFANEYDAYSDWHSFAKLGSPGWPRELYLFDKSILLLKAAAPGSTEPGETPIPITLIENYVDEAYWPYPNTSHQYPPDTEMRYATLPGWSDLLSGFALDPPTDVHEVNTDLPGFHTQTMRLIDHGRCSSTLKWIPFVTGTDPYARVWHPGILQQLHDAIWVVLRQKAFTQGAEVELSDALYQPSFVRLHAAPSTLPASDGPFLDGFSIYYKMHFYKSGGEVTNEVWVSYGLYNETGLPAIVMMSIVTNWTSSDLADVAHALLGDDRTGAAGSLPAAFATEVPQAFRDSLLGLATVLPLSQSWALLKSSGASDDELEADLAGDGFIGASCTPSDCSSDDPTLGDRQCAGPPAGDGTGGGPGILADLLGRAYGGTPYDTAHANKVVASLDPASFRCVRRPRTGSSPVFDPAYQGVCYYRPFFDRINVLPDGIEFVWNDWGQATSLLDVISSSEVPDDLMWHCPTYGAAVKPTTVPYYYTAEARTGEGPECIPPGWPTDPFGFPVFAGSLPGIPTGPCMAPFEYLANPDDWCRLPGYCPVPSNCADRCATLTSCYKS